MHRLYVSTKYEEIIHGSSGMVDQYPINVLPLYDYPPHLFFKSFEVLFTIYINCMRPEDKNIHQTAEKAILRLFTLASPKQFNRFIKPEPNANVPEPNSSTWYDSLGTSLSALQNYRRSIFNQQKQQSQPKSNSNDIEEGFEKIPSDHHP